MQILKSKIRKIGNSQGVIVPIEVLREVRLRSGSDIEIGIENGMIVIARRVPTLASLVSSVPKGKKFTEEPVGNSLGSEE